MKAVVIDKSVRPDKLSYCEVEKPVPTENEVLLKIHAVAVNAADYRRLAHVLLDRTSSLARQRISSWLSTEIAAYWTTNAL